MLHAPPPTTHTIIAAAALRASADWLQRLSVPGHTSTRPLRGSSFSRAFTRSSNPSGAGIRATNRNVSSAGVTPISFTRFNS
jgi:hypothetical protein